GRDHHTAACESWRDRRARSAACRSDTLGEIVMGWASFAIEKLQKGETVQIQPSGHSMTGKVNHKDLVTLAPCDPDALDVSDIVLVRVKGNVFLHLVKAIDNKKRFLIGNNRGKVNGWVGRDAIYGKAIKVEP